MLAALHQGPLFFDINYWYLYRLSVVNVVWMAEKANYKNRLENKWKEKFKLLFYLIRTEGVLGCTCNY